MKSIRFILVLLSLTVQLAAQITPGNIYVRKTGDTLTGNLTFSDTGEGLSLNGGGTITGASGALAFAAGTNQNITLTPSGSGTVRTGNIGITDAASAVPTLNFYDNGGNVDAYVQYNTNVVFSFRTTQAGLPMAFYTGANTLALTLDSSQNATFGGALTVSSNLLAGSTNIIGWTNAAQMLPSSTNSIVMRDSGGTGFNRLIFGTNDTSGIAIKKNTTTFGFRLGDDSADAAITAGEATFSGNVWTDRSGLATSSTDGIIIRNTTASTGGAPVQMSPRIRLAGTAWKSDATAASQTHDWLIENLPATGAASTTSTLKFGNINNGAAASYPMVLSSAGSLTITQNFTAGATNIISWTNAAQMLPSSTNSIVMRDSGGTGFNRLIFGTNDTSGIAIKKNTTTFGFRLGDDSADAAITAGNVTINASSAITGVRTATATLDFGTILAAANADLTITVSGAAVNDVVVFGPPATMVSGAVFNAWVTAANTVTVRCNNAGGISIDPASATYRVTTISQ